MEPTIVSDPNVCGGQAIFRGTRIPVYVVLDYLGAGNTIDEVIAEYPELDRDAVLAAFVRDESSPA